ncbi:BACK [Musa troglodytarum]|uniref:BACK n=1 Tax=Musa troglodytarum TaxID=320322 RepID=A0A9E7IKK9_9LILI|nr:BACK [Musa troglodytarum]
MREWRGGADPLDNGTAATEMDRDDSLPGGDNNFEFAFNSSNFSDRVLRIEVMAETLGAGAGAGIGWGGHRKRRRNDGSKEEGRINLELVILADLFGDLLIHYAPEFARYSSELVSSCEPDTEECAEYENQDEEDDPMLEESTPITDQTGVCGDDSESNDPLSLDSPCILRVNSIYISSAILAAKAHFSTSSIFLERDSEQQPQSYGEEAALMELLSFMYSGKLSTTCPTLLLDVLMAADKFEVVSCMHHCTQLLKSLPMTTESALLYLDLPFSVSMASAVQPLTDAAKGHLASSYKDITKLQDVMMGLPLAGIEAILSSNDLQAASEDAIYEFVLKWARAQYPVLEERREILSSRLIRHIRALFKAEALHRQRAFSADESSHKRFTERAYKYRPLKVVEFDRPHPQCIVYLDLKREECANLFPSGRVYSQAFHLGGQGFFLSAHCNLDQHSLFHCFGLFLGMQEKGSISFTVDYEFAARTKPSGEFVSKYKGYYTFTGGKAVGYRNLFATPWTSFMAEDSLFFINGTLHLRAELTIKQSQSPSLH